MRIPPSLEKIDGYDIITKQWKISADSYLPDNWYQVTHTYLTW